MVACNGGSGLLRDLPKIQSIFERVRASVKIPFTVKFRLGWNDSNIVCVELAKMAEDCGLNAVALHARTREQGYAGEASSREWITAVKDAVQGPGRSVTVTSVRQKTPQRWWRPRAATP